MHQADISLEHVAKVEGTADVSVQIRDGKVTNVKYAIAEVKRFYTKAVEGKPVVALPSLLARICGTCSNAHIMASIEACEHAQGITPTEQTMALRHLTMCGLNIRDHGLHLYLFALPDIVGKDNFLQLDENDPAQHQMLHDAFDIKAAGNFLSELVAGRSVHGVLPTVGGFLKIPEKKGIDEAVKKLLAVRDAAIRTVKIFAEAPFHFDRKTSFTALVPTNGQFGFLDGEIITSQGERIPESGYKDHVEHFILPYSQASGYKHHGEPYMVGALARVNLNKHLLHPKTKESLAEWLKLFPSTDIYHNNLAQAVEIVQCIDQAVDILTTREFKPEAPVKFSPRAGVGIGVIEAPRGTLYHLVETDAKGICTRGEVMVPTNQNQVNMEADIGGIVQAMLPDTDEAKILHEIEKLVRAYDPCMSCASHFLKLKLEKA